MERLLRSGLLCGMLCAGAASFSAVGCSGGEDGTDIDVGGKTATAGSAGKGTQSGAGTSSTSGTMNGDGGAADGGDGGATGSGGSSGRSAGGKGGTSSQAGTGGQAGGSGAGGSAGHAGAGGSSGNAGAAGHAGNAGTAGSGGTAGTTGNGGSAGNGGNGGHGGSGGTGGGANQDCGNGSIEGSEECDDSGPSRLCSDACETISTQACVDCEQAGDCFASSDNCKGPTASPFTAEQVGICYDVLQCIQDSNCFDGVGSTLGKCYCGTLSTAACGAAPFDLSQSGAPNGPCAEIMQLGNPGLTSNSAILGGLTTKSRPAGAAGQRLNCEKTDEACSPICGVQ